MKISDIPRVSLTGVRTFIRDHERSLCHETVQEHNDTVLFKKEHWQPANSIAVPHDLSMQLEPVCQAYSDL